MVYWELNNIKEKDACETTLFHIKSTTALQYFSICNVEKRQHMCDTHSLHPRLRARGAFFHKDIYKN